MKIKEIWTFIKTVLWPAAKPFICASREEAEELRDWARVMKGVSEKSMHQYELGSAYKELYPAFILRCIDALENEETPRQNRK